MGLRFYRPRANSCHSLVWFACFTESLHVTFHCNLPYYIISLSFQNHMESVIQCECESVSHSVFRIEMKITVCNSKRGTCVVCVIAVCVTCVIIVTG